MKKIGFLSGNTLKLIAVILMVVDHVGYILFPEYDVLRIIGRLSFPIFAFMIAEGASYTRNKARYFLLMFGCGVIYQLVLYFYVGETFMNIFITFSIAILICYALGFFKKTLLFSTYTPKIRLLAGIILVLSVGATYLINRFVGIDYGFFGCITPAVVSLFHFKGKDFDEIKDTPIYCKIKKVDNLFVSLILLSIVLVGVWQTGVDISLKSLQPYSFLGIIPLCFYNGKRGARKLKYFFYLFYPIHLLILYGISMII